LYYFSERSINSINFNNLHQLPIIDRENFFSLTEEEKTAQCNELRNVSISTNQTTGTTDRSFTVYLTQDEVRLRNLFKQRMLISCGVSIFDKICYITYSKERAERVKAWYQSLGIFRVYPVIIPDESYLERIFEINPDIIIANVDTIRKLINDLEENRSFNSHKIKKIFTSRETIEDKERQFIRNILRAEIFNNYVSSEFGLIAWECECHNGYHIEMDNFIIEVLGERRDSIVEGEIIITALNQYFMPLIRYRLGDWVKVSLEPCRCGRRTPLIKEIRRVKEDEKEKFSYKDSIII
jgi:phenylacetate-CoA ligase